MVTVQILKCGITSLETDALVNAANEGLAQGAGVCGVIFQAAGAAELKTACDSIGGCKSGSAVITPGFKLKSKYIIHAVGPRWTDGKHDEPKLLYSAYKQSLILAAKNNCKSIGFPLISAGIFGYPADKAWRKAIQACLVFRKNNPDADMDIQFAVIDDKILDIGKKTLVELNKENTTLYIKKLDEAGLQRIKEKIRIETDLLMDKKAHPIAGKLIDVICDPKVINAFSADQLIQLADSIFPESVLAESWIPKYGSILQRVVSDNKNKNQCTRAAKYEKYMNDVLIPALNEGARSGSVWDDLERLEDLYKIAVCLYRFYHVKEAEFVFDVDIEGMEEFNKAITKMAVSPGSIFDFIFPGSTEDKQYATFMSWVLEELLCVHEGLREGDE